jgi:hypothetical protein
MSLCDESTPAAKIKTGVIVGKYQRNLVNALLNRIVANAWLYESLGKCVCKTLLVVVGHRTGPSFA